MPVLFACGGCSISLRGSESDQPKISRQLALLARAGAEKPCIEPQILCARLVSPVNVHCDNSAEFSLLQPNFKVSEEIARRIESIESQWQSSCENLEFAEASPSLNQQSGGKAESSYTADKSTTGPVLAVERKNSADILNCRIRAMVLKAQLADANPAIEPMLRQRLKEAESQLAAVLESCRIEAESGIFNKGSEHYPKSTISDAILVSGR